jgi:hypothetical protein
MEMVVVALGAHDVRNRQVIKQHDFKLSILSEEINQFCRSGFVVLRIVDGAGQALAILPHGADVDDSSPEGRREW